MLKEVEDVECEINKQLDTAIKNGNVSYKNSCLPPLENCTHPRENEKCVQFFFLHECFGAIIPFEKPKIENPSRLNWINLQRDEHRNWIKKSVN